MRKFIPVLFLFLISSSLYAQKTASLKGFIYNQATGEPVTGATVQLKFTDNDSKLSISSGLDGSFVFKNLAPGKYEVEAKYISFKDEETTVELKSGETKTVRLGLRSKGSIELSDVNVSAKGDNGSDQMARKLEQRSDQVLNAVSAHTIEVSPDITVANVTQRVSGVSVERSNNGEGQYAIIRGMEKRYNYTLINGIKIPSPDNKNRYVPLDIFPADIVERLEVYKSLTPSKESDAIGGAVNLALKDAPEVFTVRANAASGYAETFFNNSYTKFDNGASSLRSPRISNGNNSIATIDQFPNNPMHFNAAKHPAATVFGLSAGGRTAGNKLGILLAGSYQNTYRGSEGLFFDTEVDRATNEPSLKSVQSRNYNIHQQRTGLHSKLDYRFNKDQKINVYAAYMSLNQDQYRVISDTNLVLGRNGMGTGRVTLEPRTNRTIQHIFNSTLQGEHKLAPSLSVNWSAVYSKATANEPDRNKLNLITGRTLQQDGSVKQEQVSIDAVKGQSRIWEYNSDRDQSAYLNFIWSPKVMDKPLELSIGGMYRDKNRNSTYDEYNLRLAGTTTQQYNGNIDNNQFSVFNTQGSSDNALNYHFTEQVSAAYAQFKVQTGRLQTLGGLRYEYANQDWKTGAPVTVSGATGSIDYFDLLPSLNFKYALSAKQNLRLSYYSAISRPGFYELVPHVGGDPDADYQEQGNPNLKRVTAENFDFRYELFPKPLDQVLVGVFYKQIENPIEFALEEKGTNIYLLADNFGTAHNYGFEADFTKYIRSFGIRANYTFTNSSITTNKLYRYRDDKGFLTQRTEQQTRSLQGQSKHIGNVSLLYKENKTGLDVQLALVYTGARINTVSPYLDNDIWQKGSAQLDFSAEKRVAQSLYVYGKANNLLNTPYELEIRKPYSASAQKIEYQGAGKNVFVRRDTYQRNYLLGLRYKL